MWALSALIGMLLYVVAGMMLGILLGSLNWLDLRSEAGHPTQNESTLLGLGLLLFALLGVLFEYITSKKHEMENAFTRVAQEYHSLENYLRSFIPRTVLQEHLDAELCHLAELCQIHHDKLKLLSEGGLLAVGISQAGNETDAEYIERAVRKREALLQYFDGAVKEFESRYDHAKKVQKSVGVTLRSKDFKLYLPPAEEKTAPPTSAVA